MSGTTVTPVADQSGFFFNNTPIAAAALDLQTAVARATALLAAYAASGAAIPDSALPTAIDGLAVGQRWNNNGVLSIVMP